jgi:hypothetical protein
VHVRELREPLLEGRRGDVRHLRDQHEHRSRLGTSLDSVDDHQRGVAVHQRVHDAEPVVAAQRVADARDEHPRDGHPQVRQPQACDPQPPLDPQPPASLP